MREPTLTLRDGQPDDAPRILALLDAAALPTSDLTATDMTRFIVATDERDHATSHHVVAAVGLEVHGNTALLRSLVVDPARRGDGIGSALVAAAEQRARELSLASITLLTQTAAPFFASRGYVQIARQAAPAPLHTSTEFASLCPASSACLHKSLAPSSIEPK